MRYYSDRKNTDCRSNLLFRLFSLGYTKALQSCSVVCFCCMYPHTLHLFCLVFWLLRTLPVSMPTPCLYFVQPKGRGSGKRAWRKWTFSGSWKNKAKSGKRRELLFRALSHSARMLDSGHRTPLIISKLTSEIYFSRLIFKIQFSIVYITNWESDV